MEVQPIPHWSLAEDVEDGGIWESFAINAVATGHVPEENLRHELQQLGAGTDRYGYITFEGEGQQVPRRIRAAVAHLHAALGHLGNDRLVRMLMLSGAGGHPQSCPQSEVSDLRDGATTSRCSAGGIQPAQQLQ